MKPPLLVIAPTDFIFTLWQRVHVSLAYANRDYAEVVRVEKARRLRTARDLARQPGYRCGSHTPATAELVVVNELPDTMEMTDEQLADYLGMVNALSHAGFKPDVTVRV